MSRYIDADAIELLLKEERDFHKKMYDNMQQPCEHDDKQIVGAYYTAYSKSYHAVKDAPTVDAVPVVRCKDCKMWGCPIPIEMKEEGYGYCSVLWTNTHENGYCAWGKRRK